MENAGFQIQVVVDEPDETGERQVSLYSRLERATADGDGGPEGDGESAWQCHASGVLARAEEPGRAGEPGGAGKWGAADARALELAGAWPPAGAQPVGVEDAYERLGDVGAEYGPAFQGLRTAWRRGEEVFAEVELSEAESGQAGWFGVHPALLDSALHASVVALLDDVPGGDGERDGSAVSLPFSWGGVRLGDAGAERLRVVLSPVGDDGLSLVAIDERGGLAVSVESLVLRAIPLSQLAARREPDESLLGVEWTPLDGGLAPAQGQALAVLGDGAEEFAGGIADLGIDHVTVQAFPDLAALSEVASGDIDDAEREQPGRSVILIVGGEGDELTGDEDGATAGSESVPVRARSALGHVLKVLQEWLADERYAGWRLVVLTHGAVAAGSSDAVDGLAESAVWGLVRSAQSEHPGRVTLLDSDGEQSSLEALPAALANATESQLAIRGGRVLMPRLVRLGARGGVLSPPEGVAEWRVEAGEGGTFEDLELVAAPDALRPLAAGEVRVAVRAAGVNFRDVLISLGMYPGAAVVGGEGAGVVLEVGEGVERLRVGDRVMGVFAGGFGPVAVTDCRALVSVPDGWSFVRAASVPIAFLTAFYGLVDLAGLGEGERVLVHAGAGGVGMAAVQLARWLGAEVFATASEGKWGVLRGLGLDDAHIASSRSLGFGDRFRERTGGEGVDVVLNSLAGEFIETSLGLLRPGGRFVEMGKADVRDAGEIGERFEEVSYRAFDLMDADPERIREILERAGRAVRARCVGGVASASVGCAAGAGGVSVYEPGAACGEDCVDVALAT